MSDAQELPEEVARLTDERGALSLRLRELDERLHSKLRAAEEAVRASHVAEFGGEIKSAKTRLAEISWRLDELRVEAARGADSTLPEGMRVAQWMGRGGLPWRLTGKIGVVEIFTAASEIPANRSYGLPSVGSRCIRILKKGGSPSLSVERIPGDALPYGWYPEGVDPNKSETES